MLNHVDPARQQVRSRQGRLHGGPDNKFDPRLNVFTVEEYESNGKTQKKWTKKSAPPSPTKKASASASNFGLSPPTVAW
jgi:hypothetical protein